MPLVADERLTDFRLMFCGEFLSPSGVTTEAVIKGNRAVFLVAGSGGATATTRGVNGRIQARGDSLEQTTATLQEWLDLARKVNFNIFASQGNQRAIMQMTTMAVLNRKIDDLIITELNTGTVTVGSGRSRPCPCSRTAA